MGVGRDSYVILPSKTHKTQYYPSKTRVFPAKPAGLGNTHKTRVFANPTLQPQQSTYNNVCQQYVYVCIYGNGMYQLLQWWLQVLTCIIILDY